MERGLCIGGYAELVVLQWYRLQNVLALEEQREQEVSGGSLLEEVVAVSRRISFACEGSLGRPIVDAQVIHPVLRIGGGVVPVVRDRAEIECRGPLISLADY